MPAPLNYSKEIILEEAFRILRTEGLEALTARNIARNLGCSTQPVYSAFGSMKALSDEVLKKAKAFAISYLLQDQNEEDLSLAMGMQYFRFARAEKVLFRLLFLQGELAMTLETMPEVSGPLVERMKRDVYLQGLSLDRIQRFGRDMWIYTHGLVAFMYESDRPDAETFVRAQLYRMGKTVIGWERVRANLPMLEVDDEMPLQ